MTMNDQPLTENELKFVYIDLDGTLAKPCWPDPGIGEPIKRNLKKAQELNEHGYKIFIYTARHSMDYRPIKRWCRKHGLIIEGIVTGKPLGVFYIDDRNLDPNKKSWLPNG